MGAGEGGILEPAVAAVVLFFSPSEARQGKQGRAGARGSAECNSRGEEGGLLSSDKSRQKI